MKTKSLSNLMFGLICLLFISSCVIEEHYHFNKEMGGHYDMTFDLGRFADRDSTGEVMKGLIDGLNEESSKMEAVEGITSIESSTAESKAFISFDFSNVEALNKLENEDNEEGKERAYFSYRKGLLSLNPNLESIKKSSKKEGQSDEEATELLNTMIEYKITVTFDEPMQTKKMEGFEQIDSKTFEYNSKVHGWDKSPILKLKTQ